MYTLYRRVYFKLTALTHHWLNAVELEHTFWKEPNKTRTDISREVELNQTHKHEEPKPHQNLQSGFLPFVKFVR